MHLPTIDLHIDQAPHVIDYGIFYFWEMFKGARNSTLLHFYDDKLEDLAARPVR